MHFTREACSGPWGLLALWNAHPGVEMHVDAYRDNDHAALTWHGGGKDTTQEAAKVPEPFWEVRGDFLQEDFC